MSVSWPSETRLPRVGRRAWTVFGVLALGSLVSLTMRARVPLNATGFLAGYYDQSRFERAAVSLANHQWLGPLDALTLAKGPAYPMFIAAMHKLNVPLQVGEQVTYLLGSGALALCVWVVTRRTITATVVYLVVAMDPVNFSEYQAQVFRDNWYAGLSMLFIGSLFLSVYGVAHRARMVWVVIAAIVAGGSGAAFWLCREEGFWLLPSALVIVVGVPIAALMVRSGEPDRGPPTRTETVRSLARPAVALVVAAAVFCAPFAYVADKNERAYGVHLINDVTGGSFPVAYAAWTRVRGVPLRPLVPIDTAQREAVYAVSPAARVLEPVLDGRTNQWKSWGCERLGICDDIPGGAMVWALRDAAEQTGQFTSAEKFQSFFRRLGAEINAACRSRQLRCAPKLPPAMQPLLRASVRPTLRAAMHWFIQVPLNSNYYKVYDSSQMFRISDEDRASLRQGVTGVPRTDAEAAREAREFDSARWLYVGLSWIYRAAFLVLIGLTAVGLLLGRRWRRDRSREIAFWLFNGCLGLAIAVRLIVLGVIGSTQFPDDVRYHYPDRMALLALVTIGSCNLAHMLYTRGRRGVASRPTQETGPTQAAADPTAREPQATSTR